MLTDWRPIERWDLLNRELTQRLLGEESKDEVRLYQGAEHAIWEVTQGLSRLFPHRRKIFYFQYQDPFHDHAMFSLLRDGFEVTALPIAQMSDPQSWQSQIGKETLLFLYSEDDPILGRKFDFENAVATCDQHKVFAVKVSHHRHRLEEWSGLDSPFAIDIKSYRADLAVAHLGSKAKIASAIAPFLEWEGCALDPILKWTIPGVSDWEKTVSAFESALPGGAQPLWGNDCSRLYDRAVFYWEDMDGHSIIYHLAEALGWKLGSPGIEERLETTSLSRWGGLRTMDWLKQQGLTESQIRGTVVLHASVLGEEIKQRLIETVNKVRQLQGV